LEFEEVTKYVVVYEYMKCLDEVGRVIFQVEEGVGRPLVLLGFRNQFVGTD
jgi:hypothetical protein